jgi:hypothetical protein
MARKTNEGMLVCIIHGALVLISRRRKLNSAAPDLLLPGILQMNVGIVCYVSIRGDPPTGRDEDIVARKLFWKAQMVCVSSFGIVVFGPGMLYRNLVIRKHTIRTYP